MRILVFGDSVVLGTWDGKGGWVDRLKQYYHERYINSEGKEKVQVYNLGIGGESSERLLKRIDNEIQARWDDRWPTAIIVATGTNDSRFLNGTTLQISVEQFQKNLTNILSICRGYTNKTMFVSPNGFKSKEVVFKGHLFANKQLEHYVEAAHQVSANQQVPMLDLFNLIREKANFFGPD
jgi:lysophospholipase L1-like esterase